MKFALTFVLLIGISCQIGRGDCAPDGIYDSLSDMVSDAYSVTQNAYQSIMDHLSPLTENLPSVPSETDSLTDGLSNMKETTESLGSKVGDMLKSGLDSIEDLGSDTKEYLKSGMDQIGDALDD